MKISKQQIDIIANAMVKELTDDTDAIEQARKEAQGYIKSFKKSKFYKDLEQIFKLWYISEVSIKCSDFCRIACPEVLWDNTSSCYNWYKNMDDVLTELENSGLSSDSIEGVDSNQNYEQIKQSLKNLVDSNFIFPFEENIIIGQQTIQEKGELEKD